jgi:hypothetical protein
MEGWMDYMKSKQVEQVVANRREGKRERSSKRD